MGGLRLSDKKRYVDFLKKGTGENFYHVLKQFYEHLKYEWAGEDKMQKTLKKMAVKLFLF